MKMLTLTIALLTCSVAQGGTFQEAEDAEQSSNAEYDYTLDYYDAQVFPAPPGQSMIHIADQMFQMNFLFMPPAVRNAALVKIVAMNAALADAKDHMESGGIDEDDADPPQHEQTYGLHHEGKTHYDAALEYWTNNNQGDPIVIANTQDMLDDSIADYQAAEGHYRDAFDAYYLAVDKAEEAIAIIQAWIDG